MVAPVTRMCELMAKADRLPRCARIGDGDVEIAGRLSRTTGLRSVVCIGASDGIGSEAARQPAGTEVRPILICLPPETTRTVAVEVDAEHHIADLQRLDETGRLVGTLSTTLGRINVLVPHTAGIFFRPPPIQKGFERDLPGQPFRPVPNLCPADQSPHLQPCTRR